MFESAMYRHKKIGAGVFEIFFIFVSNIFQAFHHTSFAASRSDLKLNAFIVRLILTMHI